MGACCSTATVGDVVDKEVSESNQSFPTINVTRPTAFAGKKKSMFKKNQSGDNDEVILHAYSVYKPKSFFVRMQIEK